MKHLKRTAALLLAVPLSAALAGCAPLAAQSKNNAAAPLFAVTADGRMADIPVATYNIKHCGKGEEIAPIAALIRGTGAQIVFLQEVDKNTLRGGNTNQAEALAKLLGFNYAFFPALHILSGEYGVAILSAFPLESVQRTELDSGGKERRVLGSAAVNLNGTPLALFTTHLSYEEDSIRQQQLRTVGARAREAGAFVIGADFNVGSYAEYEALGGVNLAHTAEHPQNTFRGDPEWFLGFDNLAGGGGVVFRETAVVPSAHSDHDLLFAHALVPLVTR